MNSISLEMLNQLHHIAISMYGGPDGILYEATLEFIIEKCNQNIDPLQISSILLHDISTMHPFEDGNKRTAVYAASMALELHGLALTAEESEIIRMGLALAQYKVSFEETVIWIQKYSRSTDQEPQAHGYI